MCYITRAIGMAQVDVYQIGCQLKFFPLYPDIMEYIFLKVQVLATT